MKFKFITNGDPNRIPKIGEHIKLPDSHWEFVVEEYGESRELSEAEVKEIKEVTPVSDSVTPYEIELIGFLSLPKGSPMEELENLLKDGIL